MKLINRLSRKNGFSLIELITTIVVASIVAIPISMLIIQHIDSSFQAQDTTLALNLASFEMEIVKNLNYANVVTQNYTNYKSYPFDLTRTVTYAQGNGSTTHSLKKIVIQVKKNGQTQVLASLTTYIVNNLSYGI